MSGHDPMPFLIQGDARHLPLPDASVDLICTSPPYFGLRSYQDGGRHYERQIGAEATPAEFLDALIACTREMVRVLKPSGSIWINLGDRYSGGGGQWDKDERPDPRHRRAASGHIGTGGKTHGYATKSLMLLPHRYAIRCVDELGLAVRQDQVWAKINSLPESVVDRTRREHEYLFHLTKRPHYYSATDEIREAHNPDSLRLSKHGGQPMKARNANLVRTGTGAYVAPNALGKLPGSVWSIPSQPLNVPEHVSHARCCDGRKREGCEAGIDHHAAFPMSLVRPIILGWSPREVCTACGEGRRPSVHGRTTGHDNNDHPGRVRSTVGLRGDDYRRWREDNPRTITGYSCACPDTTALSTPGLVVDPFGGTATTALVAAMNGRTGISVDASGDYSRVLAPWRCTDPKERARAAGLDPDVVSRIKALDPRQGSLMDLIEGASA